MADPFEQADSQQSQSIHGDPFESVDSVSQSKSGEGLLQNALNTVSRASNSFMNNFVQKSAQEQRMGGWAMSPGGMVPSSGPEIADVGRVGIKQLMNARGGPMTMAADTVDPTASFKNDLKGQGLNQLFKPQTSYGRALDTAAPMAQLGYGAAEGGEALYNKFLNPGELPAQLDVNQGLQDRLTGENDRLGKIQKYIGDRGQREVGYAEDKTGQQVAGLKQQGKDLNTQFKGGLEDLGYRGAQDIQSQVETKFQSAQDHYNSMLDSQEMGNLTNKDLLDPLNKTIEKKGISNKQAMFRDASENHLIAMRDKIGADVTPAGEDTFDTLTNQVTKGAPEQAPGLEKVTDIKDYKNKVMNGLSGRPDLQAEFMNHYGEFLKSKGLDDFAAAGKPYQDAYSALEASQDLGKTNLKRAGGTMQDTEFGNLTKQEGKVGTNYLQQAKGMKESHIAAQQDNLAKISDAEQKLAKMSQSIKTKYAGARSSVQDLIEGNQQNLEGAQNRRAGLQSNLNKIMHRRSVAKNIGLGAAGTLTGGGLIKAGESVYDLIFGHRKGSSQSNMPQSTTPES